jgi:uncharacterized protein with NAD-binding domain and iron-sulfur cluster
VDRSWVDFATSFPLFNGTILGEGYLSGIVLSHELALHGWRVTLLERSGRLGGKAGSELRNGRLVEHAH